MINVRDAQGNTVRLEESDVMPPQVRRLHEAIDWLSPELSIKGVKEAIYSLWYQGRLQEAHAATSFGQLLRVFAAIAPDHGPPGAHRL